MGAPIDLDAPMPLILFLKAQRPDARGTDDMFAALTDQAVQVKPHYDKHGRFIPGHTSTRKKRTQGPKLPTRKEAVASRVPDIFAEPVKKIEPVKVAKPAAPKPAAVKPAETKDAHAVDAPVAPWQMTSEEFGVPAAPEIPEVRRYPNTERLAREHPERLTDADRALMQSVKEANRARKKALAAHKKHVDKSNEHLAKVTSAVQAGKLVPDRVLDEYPWLRRDAAPKPKPFTPTHEAADGAPLMATAEAGVYIDADGFEVEDEYAKPIKIPATERLRQSLPPDAPPAIADAIGKVESSQHNLAALHEAKADPEEIKEAAEELKAVTAELGDGIRSWQDQAAVAAVEDKLDAAEAGEPAENARFDLATKSPGSRHLGRMYVSDVVNLASDAPGWPFTYAGLLDYEVGGVRKGSGQMVDARVDREGGKSVLVVWPDKPNPLKYVLSDTPTADSVEQQKGFNQAVIDRAKTKVPVRYRDVSSEWVSGYARAIEEAKTADRQDVENYRESLLRWAAEDAKPPQSPREGDRNADGLVFRDGRWHRDDLTRHQEWASQRAASPLSDWDRKAMAEWVRDGMPDKGLHKQKSLLWGMLADGEREKVSAEAERLMLQAEENKKAWEQEKADQSALEQSVKAKLLAGESLTDAEITGLGLRVRGSDFRYLSPVIQGLFGISKMKVREAMGDALRRATSDMGAVYWVANPRKALANAAEWVKRNSDAKPDPKDKALQAAVDHLKEDAKQGDLPAKEKREDAALVAKLEGAIGGASGDDLGQAELKYANNTIYSVMAGRGSATIGDVVFEGERYSLILKPNDKIGRLDIRLKPKGEKSFSVAWAGNDQTLKHALGALRENIADGAKITLREGSLGNAVPGKLDPEKAKKAAAEKIFKVDTRSQRKDLIERIVSAYKTPVSGHGVGPVVEWEGVDGKWYGIHGGPLGMKATGHRRVVGYAVVGPDGTSVGTRSKTEEDAWAKIKAADDRSRAELRGVLGGAGKDVLIYWASTTLKSELDRQVAIDQDAATKASRSVETSEDNTFAKALRRTIVVFPPLRVVSHNTKLSAKH